MDAQAAYMENVAAEPDETTRQAGLLDGFSDQVTGEARESCPREPPQDKSSVLPKAWEDTTAATVLHPRSDLSQIDSTEKSFVKWQRDLSATASERNELHEPPDSNNTLVDDSELSDLDGMIPPYNDPSSSLCHTYPPTSRWNSLTLGLDSGYETDLFEEKGEDLSIISAAEALPVGMNTGGSNLAQAGANPISTDTSQSKSGQKETKDSPTVGHDSPELSQLPLPHQHSNDDLANHQTETTTPDSSSFWLAEYSDDEIQMLGEDHPLMRFKTVAVMEVVERFTLWTQHPVEQDAPCHGNGQPSLQYSQDSGGEKGSTKRKRSCVDHPGTSQGDSGDSEPPLSQATSSKRRRTLDQKLTFACPYAKKDCMSYRDCYRYTLSRIRDVKQHLARCHRNPPYCPRCRCTFQTEEDRDEHIREASCPLRPSIKFEGITESQRQKLAKRSASNTPLEAQWFAVFDILFPGHEPRPQSPYIDNELLQDITLYQGFLTSNGPRILSDVLTRRGAITWNLPNDERDLTAFQQTVFEEGLRQIFEQWVARRIPNSEPEVPDGFSSSEVPSDLAPTSSSTPIERAGSSADQAPGVQSPDSTSALPGRVSPITRAGRDTFEEASSDPNDTNVSLDDILNFGQENLDFHDGPGDELTRLMLGTQSSSLS